MIRIMKVRILVPANHPDNRDEVELRREFLIGDFVLELMKHEITKKGYIIESFSVAHIMTPKEVINEIETDIGAPTKSH